MRQYQPTHVPLHDNMGISATARGAGPRRFSAVAASTTLARQSLTELHRKKQQAVECRHRLLRIELAGGGGIYNSNVAIVNGAEVSQNSPYLH